jgi:hypothetical protein
VLIIHHVQPPFPLSVVGSSGAAAHGQPHDAHNSTFCFVSALVPEIASSSPGASHEACGVSADTTPSGTAVGIPGSLQPTAWLRRDNMRDSFCTARAVSPHAVPGASACMPVGTAVGAIAPPVHLFAPWVCEEGQGVLRVYCCLLRLP